MEAIEFPCQNIPKHFTKTLVSEESNPMSNKFYVRVDKSFLTMMILNNISFRKFLTPGWRSRGAATPPASTPTDSFQVATDGSFGVGGGGNDCGEVIMV